MTEHLKSDKLTEVDFSQFSLEPDLKRVASFVWSSKVFTFQIKEVL